MLYIGRAILREDGEGPEPFVVGPLELVVDKFYYRLIVSISQIECGRNYCWQYAFCTWFFIILHRNLPSDT